MKIPKMKNIDTSKPLRTKKYHLPVEIISVYGRPPYNIVGYVGEENTFVSTWNEQGRRTLSHETIDDIENFEAGETKRFVPLDRDDICAGMEFLLENSERYQWSCVNDSGIYILGSGRPITFIELMQLNYVYRINGGKWKPCRKEVNV